MAFQLARTIAEHVSHTKGVIMAIGGTGSVQLARGEVKAALDLFQQALKLAEASSEKSLLANLQHSLCGRAKTAQLRPGDGTLPVLHGGKTGINKALSAAAHPELKVRRGEAQLLCPTSNCGI